MPEPDTILADTAQASCRVTAGTLPKQTSPIVRPAGPGYLVKALLERVVALGLLLVLSPLFLLVILAIIIEDPGSPIFVQPRFGRGGKRFGVFKFRSMRRNADQMGAQQTRDHDPRITRVGMVLRKTSIDELPQVVNVLLGQMAILGPRAHPVMMKVQGVFPADLEPDYHQRHTVRPGISGWAQVNGSRGAVKDQAQLRERLDLDLEYIRNWSLWLDLRICLASIPVVIGGRGAR